MTSVAPLSEVIAYGAICGCSMAIGGAVAAYRPPGPAARSCIQHVAAGFVFAAVGVEVLPSVMHRGLPLPAALGFAAGVVLMLTIRKVAERLGGEGEDTGRWTFIGAVVADIFVDGVLIGVSSISGRGEGRQAMLVTVALSVELLSLGLSMAATLTRSGASRRRAIVTTCIVATSPFVGALAGGLLAGVLTGGWIEGVLAFAAAALLYLATEELLKEAHEVPETLLSTSLFFAAFLILLLIDMISAG